MTTSDLAETIITRPGLDPNTAVGKPPLPPLRHEVRDFGEFIMEKDVALTLRDGTRIYLDIYRPSATAKDLGVLLAWGPYGKHNTKAQLWPNAEVEAGWISAHTGFEAPDPAYWCQRGYAVAYADPRGMWHCEGEGRHNGPQEADDVVDAIQWLGSAAWSNGRVGMLGVSYLAGIQYAAAAKQPPALKAISPWECFSDWYREFAYHGGIPETGFMPRASQNMGYSLSRTEDTHANVLANPLMSEYYAQKYPPLEDIRVPAYVVASWSDHGLHTRGTLEAFERISSEEKWLEVHGQKKWRYFYDPRSVERQREFFDYYLLDRGDGPQEWPKHRMEVRDTAERSVERTDLAWPVAESSAVRLYLNTDEGLLVEEPLDAPTSSTVHSRDGLLSFDFTFAEDRDVVGPMRLHLQLETEDSDADVFVAVTKLDRDGTEIRYPLNALFSDGPVALGWLRASHRALVEEASSELRPVHPHDREVPLMPATPTALDVELWPSGTRFHAGETLRLSILGHDFVDRSADLTSPVTMHQDLRNEGVWRVHGGGEEPSYLSLPLHQLP